MDTTHGGMKRSSTASSAAYPILNSTQSESPPQSLSTSMGASIGASIGTSKPFLHCGYLWKRRSFPLRGWHKRWFVIDQDLLHYYKKKVDERTAKRRKNYLHLFLPMVQVVRHRDQKRFRIEAHGKVIIELKSKNKEDITNWIQIISDIQNSKPAVMPDRSIFTQDDREAPFNDQLSPETSDAIKFLVVQQKLDTCLLIERKLQDSLWKFASKIEALTPASRKEKGKKKKDSSYEDVDAARMDEILKEGGNIHHLGKEFLESLSSSVGLIIQMEDLLVKGLNANPACDVSQPLMDTSVISQLSQREYRTGPPSPTMFQEGDVRRIRLGDKTIPPAMTPKSAQNINSTSPTYCDDPIPKHCK